jgi:signal transduction histidine kinase
VAQEALHNALRHAGAGRITVALSRSPRRVILEVADDGAGFAPGAPEGLGFASMRGRAEAVGGTLTIRSAPAAGTTVRLAVPLRRPAKGGARG